MTILSNFLGSRLVQQKTLCRRCGNDMDPYGRHALHCKYGPYMIRRHNIMRDQISKYLHQAQFAHVLESKYKPYNVDKGFVEEEDGKILGYSY